MLRIWFVVIPKPPVFPDANEAFDGFSMAVGAGRGVRDFLSTWESPLKPPPFVGAGLSSDGLLVGIIVSPECCWDQFFGLGVHVIRLDVQRDVLSDVD